MEIDSIRLIVELRTKEAGMGGTTDLEHLQTLAIFTVKMTVRAMEDFHLELAELARMLVVLDHMAINIVGVVIVMISALTDNDMETTTFVNLINIRIDLATTLAISTPKIADTVQEDADLKMMATDRNLMEIDLDMITVISEMIEFAKVEDLEITQVILKVLVMNLMIIANSIDLEMKDHVKVTTMEEMDLIALTEAVNTMEIVVPIKTITERNQIILDLEQEDIHQEDILILKVNVMVILLVVFGLKAINLRIIVVSLVATAFQLISTDGVDLFPISGPAGKALTENSSIVLKLLPT